MIQGRVNLEPMLTLRLSGNGDAQQEIEALIDTGYTGAMALPPTVISALGVAPLSPRSVRLADGSETLMNTYIVRVDWCGRERLIRVLENDQEPFIGVEMLKGYRLCADFVEGGIVEITER